MKEIKLTQGKVALVDDEDFDFLSQWKWCAVRHNSDIYYAERVAWENHRHKKYKMHRVILGLHDGKIHTDHKDNNGLNNQRSNLREATIVQNNYNRRAKKNCASKYKGVHRNMRTIKGVVYDYWRAQIKVKSRSFFIGNFKSETEAALAYNKKAVELHGEFANLNKVA